LGDIDYVQLLGSLLIQKHLVPKKENLSELLSMAITFEPNEAAIVLDYKLSDSLNEGQIQQISNDMLIDKISEEYPETMQAPLYHINQLLFKAYNGKFQMRSYRYGIFSDAFRRRCEKIDKENVLKLFSAWHLTVTLSRDF
jgi:hypothetical protein